MPLLDPRNTIPWFIRWKRIGFNCQQSGLLHPYRLNRFSVFDYSSPMLRYQTLIDQKRGGTPVNFD